jgi:uncharacterized membrane protein
MQLGRNRIEALTDGVFAVAMTLPVLDIKVPELRQPTGTADLPLKLLGLGPKLLSYSVSFTILGVYWVGHHIQLSFIRRADRPLLWINILFLLWVALVPFSTALLGEYPKDSACNWDLWSQPDCNRPDVGAPLVVRHRRKPPRRCRH